MKKSLLSTALIAAFIAPLAQAEEPVETMPVEPMDMVQKDFKISVKKDPVIIIDPPPMEQVDLSFDSLVRASESQYPVYFGNMEVYSSTPSCSISVMTDNGFKLLSHPNQMADSATNMPEFLASYEVVYKMSGIENQSDTAGAIMGPDLRFNMNMEEMQQASCSPAELFLAPMEINHEAADGVYSDVIRIKVEAEV
ncbi:MAG TPA: hypothetical protein ENK78_01690 [Thiothrix sp.]|nr:hypothetical protein [Thiothrix sp.]